jgi:hypothetical protein
MDDLSEKELLKRLKNYSKKDIYFLKKQWRDWISKGKYDLIQKEKGVNLQSVYDIFDQDKINTMRKAKYGERYVITLKHSKNFEIEVILVFDQPEKEDLGIITVIKKKVEN